MLKTSRDITEVLINDITSSNVFYRHAEKSPLYMSWRTQRAFFFTQLENQNSAYNKLLSSQRCPPSKKGRVRGLILQDFQSSLPQYPYCADDLSAGLYREEAIKAVRKKHIQHNSHAFTEWLAFDIDSSTAAQDWMDNNCPTPNLVIENPLNGHCHYVLWLAKPVCMTANAKPAPIRYLNNVKNGLNVAYAADDGYVGLVIKNPLNTFWNTFFPRNDPYQLDELREYSELAANDKAFSRDREIDEHTGRNKTLFDMVRFWCYDHVDLARQKGRFDQFHDDARSYAETANAFEIPRIYNQSPLDHREVAGIVRSVARWTWAHYDAQHDGKNRGALGFGETRHTSIEAPTLTDDERKRRQRAGAEYTHKARRASSEAEITKAIAKLHLDGKRVTKAAVGRLVGMSREKVSKHYSHLFE